MKDLLFRWYCFNKDGSINYDRLSKFTGVSKSDLIFSKKSRSTFLNNSDFMIGLFVGYHATSKNPMFFSSWNLKTCYHSTEDMRFINNLITRANNTPEWATYDYFIMDSTGNILYSNLNISQTIDENGIIHLKSEDYSLDHLVYPAEKKQYSYKKHFCYGRNLNDLNSFIKRLIERKIISKPKDFKKGFSQTTQTPIQTNK